MARKEHKQLPKAVVLLGPTAAGKTAWSLKLAEKFNGGIISADSRQVYRKMDIGTAKEPGEWRWWWTLLGPRRTYFVDDIPHHLMDFLDPGRPFTVAEFRDRAIKYIKFHLRHKMTPFVVGGTGLYISSLVDNLYIPRVPPNKKLRKSLEEKTHEQLMQLLMTMDEEAAKTIDAKNKRRIIRALEVCIFTGEPFSAQKKKGEPLFEFLQIGVDTERAVLHERISQRVDGMVRKGLVEEVQGLLKQKYGWHLPSMSGVGYRQFKAYFDGVKTLDEAIELLKRDTRRFARRQMTWFRRDKRIVWCKTYEEAEEAVRAFLSS